MGKMFLKQLLKKVDGISFSIKFWDEEEVIIGDSYPKFKINIKSPLKDVELLKSTSLCLGEAYINGDIEIEGDLYVALDAILGQMDKFSTQVDKLPKIFNTSKGKKKQKEEVSSHYDLGNEFYNLWLDETMSYSCAYFQSEKNTLYEAQMNKIHHILNKLNLKEGMKLLDIGCGWGYLLIEAAKKYKIKGLGITLSEEQHKKFEERIKEEGLEDYLEVKLMDYRDLERSGLLFDRVVSVGMLEHVERENYDLFFKNIDSVLIKGGVCLLHYISSLKESSGDAWIKKYIFPGGVIPSLREIISLAGEYKYHTLDVENLRLHYKMTLLEWYKNFENNISKVEKLFDEKFIRMWRMYLCSCAASFNNGVVDLHQIVFTKGINNNLPIIREYMDK